MSKSPLELLSDIITESHKQIQNDFKAINPVVSVTTKMRLIGIPSDIITIDCLATRKRILIVLNDGQPQKVNYQFCMKDDDPEDTFTALPLCDVTQKCLYDWMASYFSRAD